MLVDQALASGFDHTSGQIFEHGSPSGPPTPGSTEWWSQFEAVNAFLLMDELYGKETDKYWVAFQKAWALTRDKLGDTLSPGVCASLDAQGEPHCERKSYDWFVSYHTARALLLSANRLRATKH
jgi:mannose/cellobiose epimerase-like protein (N-acyl-D-glucosamine 2-epimerase family)